MKNDYLNPDLNDTRCCGSDACIIDPTGKCWCGQIWDGEKMVFPTLDLNQNDVKLD